MAGTKIGGVKTAATCKAKFGDDYFKKIGVMGGVAGTGHTFAHGKVSPREAGAKGGMISKRRPKATILAIEQAEFQAGFNQPSWSERLLSKFSR